MTKPDATNIKLISEVSCACKSYNLISSFKRAAECFPIAQRSLPGGLKWHCGGLIILLPHPAACSDTGIISGLWINSVTKERSAAPARPESGGSGDYEGEWDRAHTSSAGLSLAEFKGLRSTVSLIEGVYPMTIRVQVIKAGIPR